MRDYKKILQGGRFKWYLNPSDINDVAGTAESCLGLTRGANINIGDQELKNIEADGQLGMVKGGQRITDLQPSVQITLLQWNEDVIRSMKRFLVDESVAGQITYRPKGQLEDIDYIDKLVGIGELVDGSIMRVILTDAVVSQLPSLELADKDEVTMPVTFMGTYDSPDSKVVPISITILDKATNAAFGAAADAAIKGQTITLSAATDIADEATFRAAADTGLQALITAAVDTTGFPNADFKILIQDGEKTIDEVLQGSSGDSFVLSYNLDTSGIDPTGQPYQTTGTFTVTLSA